MEPLSRNELYTLLNTHPDWKNAWMLLDDGNTFESVRKGISTCMGILSQYDFPKKTNHYPIGYDIIQKIIQHKTGYRTNRLVMMITCKKLGIPIWNTGHPFSFMFPVPGHPEALKEVRDFFIRERGGSNARNE